MVNGNIRNDMTEVGPLRKNTVLFMLIAFRYLTYPVCMGYIVVCLSRPMYLTTLPDGFLTKYIPTVDPPQTHTRCPIIYTGCSRGGIGLPYSDSCFSNSISTGEIIVVYWVNFRKMRHRTLEV